MPEASVSNSAATLCSLLTVILTWYELNNLVDIYEHHKESMAKDFLHQYCTRLGNIDLEFDDDIFNLALNDLQDKVLSMGSRKLFEYGLPQPQTEDNDKLARVYRREKDYNQVVQQAYVESKYYISTYVVITYHNTSSRFSSFPLMHAEAND